MSGIDGSVRRVWLRCDCGKLHAAGGSSPTSVCGGCGRQFRARLVSDQGVMGPPAPVAEFVPAPQEEK